ncbi:MAG: HAMP domain-containing histidine kinase [Lachnospiraceae bacterium]|nr:HAMP domain-containing histidine kinase [Lachnospiraceae bacterium]
MIRKLRRQFITITMLALLAVLVLIIGIAAVMNYRALVAEAEETIDMLSSSYRGDSGSPADGADASSASPGSGWRENNEGPGGFGRIGGRISEELPYRSRYFTVTLDREMQVRSIDLEHIVSVTEAEASEMALSVMQDSRDAGFSDAYRYRVFALAPSGYRVLFLDRSPELSTFARDLLTSILVALAGLLAVFLLVFLISGRVVQPLAESYEKQKMFITNAGHELKTPLAIINADADVLEMGLDGENEFLQDIRKQTGRMAALTDELVTLARMDEQKEEKPGTEQVDLSSLLSEAAESYRGIAASKGIHWSEDVAENVEVRGDGKTLARLCGILLDNAFKYTGEGGRIGLALAKSGRQAVLTVTNTCAEPVSREACAHLFERFYRTETSRGSGKSGFGLGLAIAEAIVRAHRGRISAVPEENGQALRMTVQLPLT